MPQTSFGEKLEFPDPSGTSPVRNLQWWFSVLFVAGCLGLCSFALYFLPAILGRPLAGSPDALNAVIAREMMSNGNYVVPTVGGEAALQTPPLDYWLIILTAKVFGVNPNDTEAFACAALFPSAACAALTVFLTVICGCVLFCRASGIAAGLVLFSSALFVRFAQSAHGDLASVLGCTAALVGSARVLSRPKCAGGIALTMLGFGAAVLATGYVPLLLLLPPLLAYPWLSPVKFTARGYVTLALALLGGLALAGCWFVILEQRAPGSFSAYVSESRATLLSDDAAGVSVWHQKMSILCLALAGLLPWTALLFFSGIVLPVARPTEKAFDAEQRGEVRLFLAFAVWGWVVALLAGGPPDDYLLPAIPAIALAFGALTGLLDFPGGIREERMGWVQFWLGWTAAVVLAAAAFIPGFANAMRSAGGGFLADSIAALAGHTGALAAVAAGVVAILTMVCMRQWVAGRGVLAVVVAAAAAAGMFAFLATRPGVLQRQRAFRKNVAALKSEVAAYGPDVRLFVYGSDAGALSFYTGRIVLPLDDLLADPKPVDSDVPIFVTKGSAAALQRDRGVHVDLLGTDIEIGLGLLRKDDPGLIAGRKAYQERQRTLAK